MTYEFTTLQFFVPKAAERALDRAIVAERARAAGLEHTRFEYSTHRMPASKGLITCNVRLAPIIIDAFTELAGRSTGQLVLDCGAAAQSGLDALGRASDSGATHQR